jgi:molecular chaperone GrpE
MTEREDRPERSATGEQADGDRPVADGAVESERVADLEERLLRALADADNTRKRCVRQIAEAQTDERSRVTGVWLSIVDNLDRALEHADAEPAALVEGVRAIRDEALSLLGSLGYPRHEETDVPFDPQRHEAVAVVPDGDAPAGTVLQVVRPGYGDGSRQLRPAAVTVAVGPE